jgi:hypothetical protein
MDIMEPRRLEAWREFSLRLKVLAFIGREVYRHARDSRKAVVCRRLDRLAQ